MILLQTGLHFFSWCCHGNSTFLLVAHDGNFWMGSRRGKKIAWLVWKLFVVFVSTHTHTYAHTLPLTLLKERVLINMLQFIKNQEAVVAEKRCQALTKDETKTRLHMSGGFAVPSSTHGASVPIILLPVTWQLAHWGSAAKPIASGKQI